MNYKNKEQKLNEIVSYLHKVCETAEKKGELSLLSQDTQNWWKERKMMIAVEEARQLEIPQENNDILGKFLIKK